MRNEVDQDDTRGTRSSLSGWGLGVAERDCLTEKPVDYVACESFIYHFDGCFKSHSLSLFDVFSMSRSLPFPTLICTLVVLVISAMRAHIHLLSAGLDVDALGDATRVIVGRHTAPLQTNGAL